MPLLLRSGMRPQPAFKIIGPDRGWEQGNCRNRLRVPCALGCRAPAETREAGASVESCFRAEEEGKRDSRSAPGGGRGTTRWTVGAAKYPFEASSRSLADIERRIVCSRGFAP